MIHSLTKQQMRHAKAAHRAQKHQLPVTRHVVDCACVLHGNKYDWSYVERLYNMLCRNLSMPVQFHVYTEHDRSVPPHMIKHCLEEWPGISGPKKSWWYKLQMFNPEHHSSDLLYFDLDTVVVANIDWLTEWPTDYVWTIRDFRWLQRPTHDGMNSSVMWWNVSHFSWVWSEFLEQGAHALSARFHGDQDFLNAVLGPARRRYLPDNRIQSWRWQAHDGGWDWRVRRSRAPGTGTRIDPDVSVLVFHGNPKPHQITDPVIQTHWQ